LAIAADPQGGIFVSNRCRLLTQAMTDDGLENAADFGLKETAATVNLWP
jgi:hypothetical protein